MSAERPHHPYSCSQLSSLRACPSYEGVQSDTPHIRTVAGTKGHAIVETGDDDPTLDDETAAQAAQCRQFYAEQLERMGPGAIEIAEDYWAIDSFETTAGYVDAAIISADKTRAVLLDWKFGLHPVEPAATNAQVWAYCLGLFRAFPTVETVDAFILQPPVSDEPTTATFTREQVPAMRDEIWAIVTRAKAARAAGDFSQATPHYPLCQFCKHAGRCPALAKMAGEIGHKYAPLLVPEVISPAQIYNPEKIKEAWQLAAVVKTWSEGFRQVITDRVISGECEAPPGHKLVSTSKRKIVDAGKYQHVALKFLTEEEYQSTLASSLGAVEDLISQKAPRGQKTKQVENFSELAEATGAVALGDSFTFLKAIPVKKAQ